MNKFSIQNREGSKPLLVRGWSNFPLRSGPHFRSLAIVACAASLVLGAFNAVAADASKATSTAKSSAPVVVKLKQFKVIKDDLGDVKFVDASVVVPGDVIEYRAVYFNQGSSALPVVATLPIPASLEYLKDSASSDSKLAHTVALKDSQFSKEPLMQKVITASGVTVSQPLPYATYRYVRWDLGSLSPGKSVEVSVRAKVAQNLEVEASIEDKPSILASLLSVKR